MSVISKVYNAARCYLVAAGVGLAFLSSCTPQKESTLEKKVKMEAPLPENAIGINTGDYYRMSKEELDDYFKRASEKK